MIKVTMDTEAQVYPKLDFVRKNRGEVYPFWTDFEGVIALNIEKAREKLFAKNETYGYIEREDAIDAFLKK